MASRSASPTPGTTSNEPRRGSRPSAGADHARSSPGGQRLGRGDACPQARATRPRVSPTRLRSLAEAAAREQVAWEHAHAAGLLWRPVPGAERAQPPYELRPGTGRRGPEELWARFDAAVAALNNAITGSSSANVADAFGELSEAAGALADAVAAEDAAPRTSKRFSRNRGVA